MVYKVRLNYELKDRNKNWYLYRGYDCPKLTKNETIRNWKKYGLIDDNYDLIYERLVKAFKCEICSDVFKCCMDGRINRAMDHCHKTGLFRSICCFKCNKEDKGYYVI